VDNPCGLSVPFSLAEKLAMNVPGLVVTTGGPGIGEGVGVGVAFVTVTVPLIPQHAPCSVQKYGNDPAVLNVCVKTSPAVRRPESQSPFGDPGVPEVVLCLGVLYPPAAQIHCTVSPR
jgi:hypothetical protein